MTADHIHPMLDNEHDSELLSQAASILAQGTIPREVLDGMRLGRLTVLRKPVLCDVLWQGQRQCRLPRKLKKPLLPSRTL